MNTLGPTNSLSKYYSSLVVINSGSSVLISSASDEPNPSNLLPTGTYMLTFECATQTPQTFIGNTIFQVTTTGSGSPTRFSNFLSSLNVFDSTQTNTVYILVSSTQIILYNSLTSSLITQGNWSIEKLI